MYKKKETQLLYIGISAIWLLLLLTVGISVYKSPENSEKKGTYTEKVVPHACTNVGKGTSRAGLDLQKQSVDLCATDLNVIHVGNAGLLGVLWWLSRDYAKQLRSYQVQSSSDKVIFSLSRPHYIVVGVVLVAMMGYIGYFFYQKYLVLQVPSYRLSRDVALFSLMSLVTSMCFYPIIFRELDTSVQADEVSLKIRVIKKVLLRFIVSDVVYLLAIGAIERFRSNDKIKIFGEEGDMMWLFSIVVLTSMGSIMHLSTACTLFARLLWAIPLCFLYVQIYGYPQLLSCGNKKIDKMVAYLFQTSHLWEGLGCVYMIYHLDFPFYRVMGAWVAWECLKHLLYDLLYYLVRKKNSCRGGATQSLTAFWLYPHLDIVCTTIVIWVGCIYEYGCNDQSLDMLVRIGMLCLPALPLSLGIKVWCYSLASQKEIAGILVHFLMSVRFAYIVELLTPTHNNITAFLQGIYCCICYLTIVVWIQSLLDMIGLKGYKKTPLPAWYSIASQEIYVIAVGCCNVLIQIGICHWILGTSRISLSMLLLIVTYGTQISIYLKLYQPSAHYATIISFYMAYTYYIYSTKYLYSTWKKWPTYLLKAKRFDQFFLVVAIVGFFLAIIVSCIQHIALNASPKKYYLYRLCRLSS